jgi:chromate transporter
LRAITAAVVGVIANLSVWFALHVLFERVLPMAHLALPLPDWSSIDPIAGALTLIAAVLMLAFRFGIVSTMAVTAMLALGWNLLL